MVPNKSWSVPALAAVLAVTLASVPIASPPGGPAQAAPDILARLLGDWSGQGVVTGRASEITMTWERAVGGAFVRLRFRNAMAASETRPAEVFEAHGYYRASGPSGTGTWIDGRGIILPLRLTLSGDALVSDWGSESSVERGRTTYRLTPDDRLELIDTVRGADGQYREFGRSDLGRVR